MPEWILAALAGLAAGGALVAGAVIAWFVRVPTRVVAAVMAFGAGVLISALAYDLVLEAQAEGGFWPTVGGFALGAVVYVVGNQLLDRYGKRNPRGSGGSPGTGTGIALGALLDGIPESAVLGLSMVGGSGVSLPVLLAIVISNVPEGLSSTAELKQSGSVGSLCGPALVGHRGRERARSAPRLRSPRQRERRDHGVHHRDRGRRDPRDDLRHDDPRGVPFGARAHRPARDGRLPTGLRRARRRMTRQERRSQRAAVSG